MTSMKKICPHGGSENIAKIIYGMLDYSENLLTDLRSGGVMLGGCIVDIGELIWYCGDCEEGFGETTLRPPRKDIR